MQLGQLARDGGEKGDEQKLGGKVGRWFFFIIVAIVYFK